MSRQLVRFPLFALLWLLFQTHSFSDGNLPQAQAEARIKGKDNRQLREYFSALTDLPETLDSTVEATIARNVPAVYRKGCSRMVKAWGKLNEGQSQTLIRPLHILQQPGERRHVFLTFTCYSLVPQYARYYDERLMVLTIDSAFSLLTVLPPIEPCDSCSTLAHIGLDDTLHIGGNPAVSFIFTMSNVNPCCNAIDSVDEEVHNYYSFVGRNVEQILSLLKSRREVHQTQAGSQSTTTVDVDLYTQKDSDGNLSEVVATKSTKLDDRPQPVKITWYQWNGKMGRFVETSH